MKRPSADTRKRQEELVSELRHVAEEIPPLTDSVDSLYLLLQHVWQNREEFLDLLNGYSERTTVRCERCSCCPALADAISDGWKDVRKDDGEYRGLCPPCHAAVDSERVILPKETIFCTCCDATSESLAESLRAGWQCIIDDEGNERGNYAGMCPGCIAEEEGDSLPFQQNTADETPSEASGEQKLLF